MMRSRFRRRSAAALFALLSTASAITGCATNAAGLRFDLATHRQAGPDEARMVFFRDHATYVVQAPHIVSADVYIDGVAVSGLKNGGFSEALVRPGRHVCQVGTGATALGSNETVWPCDALAGGTSYFQVWDKTRMEGARAGGGLVVGAVAGGVGGAVGGAQQAENISSLKPATRDGAIAGAVQGGVGGAVAGFRGRVREGEGRVWAVDQIGDSDALPILRDLFLSD